MFLFFSGELVSEKISNDCDVLVFHTMHHIYVAIISFNLEGYVYRLTRTSLIGLVCTMIFGYEMEHYNTSNKHVRFY